MNVSKIHHIKLKNRVKIYQNIQTENFWMAILITVPPERKTFPIKNKHENLTCSKDMTEHPLKNIV